jgi:hypothetical protein
VAAASLVVAILTLLIALPGAVNDWTTLRTPRSTPTDTTSSTTSVTPTTAPSSPSNRPSSPPPSKTETAKPDQNKSTPASGVKDILHLVNTFRANLGVWGVVSVVAAGAVVIFLCAGVCRFVIITSYWPIGIPTWAILIAIPFLVWPSISGNGTTTTTVLGVLYFATSVAIAAIAKVIADP